MSLRVSLRGDMGPPADGAVGSVQSRVRGLGLSLPDLSEPRRLAPAQLPPAAAPRGCDSVTDSPSARDPSQVADSCQTLSRRKERRRF